MGFVYYINASVCCSSYTRPYFSFREKLRFDVNEYNTFNVCHKAAYYASIGVHFYSMVVKFPIKRFTYLFPNELDVIRSHEAYNLKDIYCMFSFYNKQSLIDYFKYLKLKKCYLIDLFFNYDSPKELDFELICKEGLQKEFKVFVMKYDRLKLWSEIKGSYDNDPEMLE